MILAEPPRTPYDLHFQVAGFPVRIHPFFWLMGLILGSGSRGDKDFAVLLLMWVGVLFVSILIHELGHAFAMRRFGQGARIVLYMMGGLAIPDAPMFGSGYGRSFRSSREQIIISAAGPFAGFIFAAAIIGLVFLTGGHFEFVRRFPIFWHFELGGRMAENQMMYELVHMLLYINIFWGLVNLLPIFPLDGGQICREIMIDRDPSRGMVQTLWISVFAGGAVAVYGMSSKSLFMAIMFGSLALNSYMNIQRMTGRGGGWGGGRPW